MIRAIRRHATTIALTVLAAGGIAAVLADRGSVTTDEATERKKNLFEAFRPDDVTAITVAAQGETATIARGDLDDAGQRRWQVEIAGARYPADESLVDRYLSALEMGTADRWVPAGSIDRAAFGLGSPVVEVTVAMGKPRIHLAVGGPAPIPVGGRYAEIEGRGVAVISRELFASLDARPEELRARALVPYSIGDAASLSIRIGDGGARALTHKGASFLLEGGGPDGAVRAGPAAVEKIGAALGGLEADAFLDPAEAEKALVVQASVTIAPRDPGRGEVAIDLGGPCPGHPDDLVAVRRKPDRTAACVARDAIEALSAADLVDRRALAAPIDQVAEIKIEGGGHKVELARKGPQWHLRSPEDRPLDAETGRAFAEALLAVEADRLVPGGDRRALGLDPPRATLRLISVVPGAGADGGDEERIETLEIGAEQGAMVHVRRAEDGATLEIPKDRAAPLLPDATALRARKVFDEPEDSVRSIRVEGGGRVQKLARGDDGAFHLVEPRGEGLEADLVLAGELGRALASLTAERWIGAKEPSFGLDAPRLVIEAELGDRPDAGARGRSLRVAIGAPSASGSFAQAGGDDAVFLAPHALEEAADRWLLDRTLTRVAPETIARATITADRGKAVTIERSGEVLQIAGAPASPVSSARAATIRDALADLMAEGAVGIGPPDKRWGFDKPSLDVLVERAGVGTSAKVPPVHLRFGAADAFQGTRVYYARRDGVDATFAIAQERVRPLLDAASGK
jgi:Domain of unknown function (DUF4340)